MADDEPKNPESAASSTKRDEGPPTTIDEAAPDTRIEPEHADDAVAGLKAISRTIKMSDGDPIPDPAPSTSARASSPSEEAITVKKKPKAKVMFAGAAAEPDASASEIAPPDAPVAEAKLAAAKLEPRSKKRAVQKTLPDDGGLSQTLPDPLPVELPAGDKAATKPRKRLPTRKPPSTLSNPLVWVVGALMLAALVAFGIFLASSGNETTKPAKTKSERSARLSPTPNVPLPEAPQSPTPTPTSTELPAQTETPTPAPTPTHTTSPTPTPKPTTTNPTPVPTPKPSGSTTPSPTFTFTIPTVLPSFPGVGTPPGQTGSSGP